MKLLSPTSVLSPGQTTLRSLCGTAWLQSDSREIIGSVLEYEQQMYGQHTAKLAKSASLPAIDRIDPVEYQAYQFIRLTPSSVQQSQSGQQAIAIPGDILYVNSVVVNNRHFDYGVDYAIAGDRLIFKGVPSLRGARYIELRGVNRLGRCPLEFWSQPLDYREHLPGTWRFLRALHRCHQAPASRYTLCELLASAVEVPCVTSTGEVTEVIERSSLPPIVVTTAEMLVGRLGDTPTVDVGQPLAPGDFVFDSLRFHDFQESLPIWLNQLTVPPSYFDTAAGVSSPLTISTTSSVPSDVSTTQGLVHLQLPWTGDANSIAGLYARSVEVELAQGKTLAEALIPGRSAADWETTELNWLDALWSTWLRHGASVSLLRDKPTSTTLSRLSQVRRAIPPWTTHFIQFMHPADETGHAFC